MDGLDPASPKPHGVGPHTVNCGECHETETTSYVSHGRLKVGADGDIPTCADCHGHHDILPSSDRNSHVHPSNVPKTCLTCHADVDLVEQHDILIEGPLRLYASSVHGQATRKGLYAAANCNHCHSSPNAEGKPTAHRILGPADPASTIYRFNIPDTCGKCHESTAADFWEGIHGQLVKRGEVDAPVCTSCHGEHGIISPDNPASPVSSGHVAEQTCSPCHESVVLNEKYGIPGGRLKSYVDSYHGHKSRAGSVQVANCASCHGAHRILRSTNPESSIHVSNLEKTCGECHPGISPQLAKAGIHKTATGHQSGWPEFFRELYIVLITVVIGGMLLHNGADWFRLVRNITKQPFVLRLTVNETMQHWALAISFVVLVLSGFALRFSDAWWVQFLFGWGDGRGFEFRGLIHRIAAVVLLSVSLWHVLYWVTARGRLMLREMMPRMSDIRHLYENIKFFMGRNATAPRFRRFSYMEKAEYWALMWGTAVMVITGLFLAYDNYFIEHWNIPKGVLDVLLVVHYWEAWLASLAILVWHIYGTVLRPGVYPMNPAWLVGRMPKEMYLHEHADGPRLRARKFRKFYEDEELANEALAEARNSSDADTPASDPESQEAE